MTEQKRDDFNLDFTNLANREDNLLIDILTQRDNVPEAPLPLFPFKSRGASDCSSKQDSPDKTCEFRKIVVSVCQRIN